AVDLRHQEDALAITIFQRLSHALLARAVVVVPAVVHEVDAVVHSRANDACAQFLINKLETEVPSTKTDERDFHSRPPQRPHRHFRILLWHYVSSAKSETLALFFVFFV